MDGQRNALTPISAADLVAVGPCLLEVEAATTLSYGVPAARETEVKSVLPDVTYAAAA